MFENIKDTLFAYLSKFQYNRKVGYVVGGILIVLLLTLLIGHETDTGTKQAATELAALDSNIRKAYQNRPGFWGLSTQTVIDKKIYPQKMLQNGVLKGFFGNEVLVGEGINAQVLMPGSRRFDIIYKKLNKKQCLELSSFKFDEKFWLGITGITIDNGKQSQYFSWNDGQHTLPISKSKAQAFCKKNNIIIWHNE